MEIKSFNDFSSGGKIYEDKKPPKQNTPTQTDTDYRENISIPKQDTGDDSAGLYTIFLTQANMVINSMGTTIAPINSKKGDVAKSRLVAIVGNIKPTYESHRNLWNGIEETSNMLGGDYQNASKGKMSSINMFDQKGLVLDTFRKNMQDLEDRLKTKDLNDTQYEEKAKEIRVEANNQLLNSNNLYSLKRGKALDYYMQAIKVYKKGALVCLQNMESESEDSDNKTSGKKYLDIITKDAINILGK